MDLDSFPTKPGVYLMYNVEKKLLYVGKAKNLRKRIQQYITLVDTRPQVPLLMQKVTHIETIIVSSEKEALLLENTLIKKHKPKFNILLKDDKSYISLKLSHHKWPSLHLVRSKERFKRDGDYFGPYTSAFKAREALDFLQRIFPLRECSDKELSNRVRPCILYQMHRCLAPCCNLCTPEEYQGYVLQVKQFLQGKNKELLTSLQEQMHKASEAMQYEKAASLLRTIKNLEEITKSSMSHKDEDVIALFHREDTATICRMVFHNGVLVDSMNYLFTDVIQSSSEILTAFLLQTYLDREERPNDIIISHKIDDLPFLSEILSTTHSIKLTIPQKGSKKKALLLALENAKAHFQGAIQEKDLLENTLLKLQETLFLNNYPENIVCFDNSHLSGSHPVSAMVAFTAGMRDTKKTRYFNLNSPPANDIKAMEEVLLRYLRKSKISKTFPDLIIVDGGIAQLNAAKKICQDLDIASIDIISLVKEKGRHDKGLTQERVYLENKQDIAFKKDDKLLFFLQRIRDDAHTLAITFHKKKRKKSLIHSALEDIPGIGPIKQRALMKAFKNVSAIKKASIEELVAIPNISQKDALAIQRHLT